MDGPRPGCPANSTERRRWLNHHSCDNIIDEDNPQYYFFVLQDPYGTGSPVVDYDPNGALAPAPGVLPAGFAGPPPEYDYAAGSEYDMADDIFNPDAHPGFLQYCLGDYYPGPEPYYEGVCFRCFPFPSWEV